LHPVSSNHTSPALPAVSKRAFCEQVTGQDEQQPRKVREPRVSQPAEDFATVVDVDEVELTQGTTSDAEEYGDMEEIPLDLDDIVLAEPELPNADVTEWT